MPQSAIVTNFGLPGPAQVVTALPFLILRCKNDDALQPLDRKAVGVTSSRSRRQGGQFPIRLFS